MTFKKHLFKAFICFFLFISIFSGVQSAKATDLPPGVVEYITKNFPGSNIRFDGLVELTDGTIYLPVLPISYPDNEVEIRVMMTQPENVENPDLMIFSNNLSMLKIIKNESGEKTILSGVDVPLKVKLGLLPQDLIVPEGLIIPSDMRSIVGDLVVPCSSVETDIIKSGDTVNPFNTVSNDNIVSTVTSTNTDINTSTTTEETTTSTELPSFTSESLFGLNDRMLYVLGIGGNQLHVVDPRLSKIVNSVKIGPLPYKVIVSPDKKHLYVVCLAGNSLASVNIESNKLENIIKVGRRPTDLSVSPDGTKIYVSNSGSGNVSVVNAELFEIVNNLEIQGMPEGVLASNDNRSFYSFNRASGIVSKWDSLNSENRQFLFMIKNPYAMAVDSTESKLYVISRTQNSLMVYNILERKSENLVKVGEKPTGLAVSYDNKYIYTLDSGDDQISIVDANSFEVVGVVELRSGGFPSGLSLIPGTNKALITNAESDKLLLVDLDAKLVLTTIPIGITSKTLTIGPGKNFVDLQPLEVSE